MAIAYLASSFDSNSSIDSSTTSWAYDSLATGTDRILVVFPVYENNTNPADITAVTYNGVSLVFQEVYVDNGGGFAESIEAWTLVAPATGSNTLAFTISQTGRDLGFSAAVYTGVDQTTPVGNTAISAQYNDETGINADLVFASNSMGVYCSSQNRSNTGPFTARTSNTQRGEYVVATGNSGFTACLGDRGPEASAATYNCGSDATSTSIGGGCVAIELLEAAAGGISITETLENTNYTSLDPAIDLTGLVSITETLENTNYTSLNPVVDLTGLVDITETLVNTNYASLNPAITLTAGILVTEQLKNINYTSLDTTITLTGVISITEQLENTNYTSLDPIVDLTGLVDITENLVNTNYTALNPVIDFTGLVDITENLVNTNYATLNPVITLVSGIEIISQVVNTQYAAQDPSILLTPEPLGIVSTVCFPGTTENLEFDGINVKLEFSGSTEELEFNGDEKELAFNGTIKTTCSDGDINTNC